jgi:hypothetical protein
MLRNRTVATIGGLAAALAAAAWLAWPRAAPAERLRLEPLPFGPASPPVAAGDSLLYVLRSDAYRLGTEGGAPALARFRLDPAKDSPWHRLLGSGRNALLASWDPDSEASLSLARAGGGRRALDIPGARLLDVAATEDGRFLVLALERGEGPSHLEVRDAGSLEAAGSAASLVPVQGMMASEGRVYAWNTSGEVEEIFVSAGRLSQRRLAPASGERALASLAGGAACVAVEGGRVLVYREGRLALEASSAFPSPLAGAGGKSAAAFYFAGSVFGSGGEVILVGARDGPVARWRPPGALDSLAVSDAGALLAIDAEGTGYLLVGDGPSLRVARRLRLGEGAAAAPADGGFLVGTPAGFALIKDP